MPTPNWWAQGDLFEGCNCDSLCPCHVAFRQKSTNETCDGAWGVHIEEGQYGDVDTSGLNALMVFHCPGPSMFDGQWVALLYTDDQATPQQEEALTAILSGEGGGPWARIARFFKDGRLTATGRAPFEFAKDRRTRTLMVQNIASLEVQGIQGADPEQEVAISNLYSVIHGPEHVIARSNLSVDAQGLKWDNSGKHGLYSHFKWSGP
jgi:hypothetical protein